MESKSFIFHIVIVYLTKWYAKTNAFYLHSTRLRHEFSIIGNVENENTRNEDGGSPIQVKIRKAARNHNSHPGLTLSKESHEEIITENDDDLEFDTMRVRIWRALASGDELSMKELGSKVGERRLGDLKDHLSHVEKQAKTLKNKSHEWRDRRGLIDVYGTNNRKVEKLRLIRRKGKKNTVFVRLG